MTIKKKRPGLARFIKKRLAAHVAPPRLSKKRRLKTFKIFFPGNPFFKEQRLWVDQVPTQETWPENLRTGFSVFWTSPKKYDPIKDRAPKKGMNEPDNLIDVKIEKIEAMHKWGLYYTRRTFLGFFQSGAYLCLFSAQQPCQGIFVWVSAT